MRSSLFAVFLAFTAAFSAAFAEPLPSVPLPPELDRVLRDYEHAWAANDPEMLAQLFAAEGVALPNGQPPARGVDGIRKAYSKGAGSPLSLRAFAYSISGDLAYVVGGYGAARDKPDFGKFVLVLRRSGEGRWLLLADMDNMSVPLPPPQRPERPAPPSPD